MVKNKLVESLAKSKAAAKDKNLQDFIRIFYSHCDEEELSQTSEAELFKLAKETFEFMQKREAGKPKIVISNPTEQEKRPRTYVMILNDDKPFIVDSINSELSRFGLKTHKIYHPVYGVKRDKANKFVGFDKKGKEESLIFAEITHVQAGKAMTELQESFEEVLHSLYISVEDWPTMLAKVNEVSASLKNAKGKFPAEDIAETEDFVRWLADNHFTFLSYGEYKKGKDGKYELIKDSQLGIARAGNKKPVNSKAVEYLANSKQLLEITKSSQKAMVHRNVYMDQIGIKKFNSKGEVIGECWFAGLFASSAYYQSTDLIPFIRRKVDHILSSSGFSNGSHMGKIAKFILDSYPRDEIFQSTLNELQENVLAVVDLIKRPRVGTFLRRDKFERFMTCLIYVPKEKFDTNLRYRLQDILQDELDGIVTEFYTQISDSPLSRLYLTIVPNGDGFPKIDEARLRRKVAESANIWSETLQGRLFAEFGEVRGEALYAKYENAFSKAYQAVYQGNNAVHDIKKIEQCLKWRFIAKNLHKTVT